MKSWISWKEPPLVADLQQRAIQRRVIRAIVLGRQVSRRRGSPGFQPGRSSFRSGILFRVSIVP